MTATKDFSVRGFHLDLRIQIMTMKALKQFAKDIAKLGLNTLVLEWEATFPYDKHATISNRFAYTREEIAKFVEYCEKLGIDVIPLQQCFGHTEYILRHDRYSYLSENEKDISQICPLKKDKAQKVFQEIFEDIASLHNSEYIHIGGDETWLLGTCEDCAETAKKHNKSKLYVDYIKMICDIVIGLGKRPVLWADIILKNPEAVSQLPKKTIFIDWNYGWEVNHFGDIGKLQAQGCEFWGAPSLRSSPDNYFLTQWEYHFNNLKDFVPFAKQSAYTGIIMTSWSTSGGYGYEWDSHYEVVEVFPIRHVYPLSGFKILLEAYVDAINSDKPINPATFAKNYAKERFGLDAKSAEDFWKALKSDTRQAYKSKAIDGKSVKSILTNAQKAQKLLAAISPRQNKEEFEHFKLMFDIREYYLCAKDIESFIESDKFSLKKAPAAAAELKKLLNRAPKLDARFSELNKGYLYDSELQQENSVRNKKIQSLYERMKRIR